MKIERFALERWMTAHELNVEYDIAESGIFPLTISDLLALEPADQREQTLDSLLNLSLGYSEATGTLELRSWLAKTYLDCTPYNILVRRSTGPNQPRQQEHDQNKPMPLR